MSIAIPERILNYRISATTPTDELLTLRHIYSDIGEYASTILDREHTALSKKCATRLNKVEKQLSSRQNILSAEEVDTNFSNLSALTVDELYQLYRGWHLRHRKREAEGRELMTFYYEGKIVKEVQRRKPTDNGEQLKIDYCTITYRNELENLAFIFSLPVSSHSTEFDKELPYPDSQKDMKSRETDNGLICPESDRGYSLSELLALIKLYSHYHTIAERELLIEYVDMALDLMSVTTISTDKIPYMALASELVEIDRKDIVKVPNWVSGFLEETIEAARKDKTVHESDLVLPILTLQLQNGSSKLEREARRIINRCYRRAISLEGNVDSLVDDLYIAVSCCDYISRFSVKKIGKSWNELARRFIDSITAPDNSKAGIHSSATVLDANLLIQLLRVADEIGDYVSTSADSKKYLSEILRQQAELRVIEAQTYLHRAS
ncbi:MAG: hypothetical protein K2J78_07855 [Muribaculaceae bacterium]|nr:hypothetical protein [Muribaculaceae bacterium]